MTSKDDRTILAEMLDRIGPADLLDILGGLLKERASREYEEGDAAWIITDRAADDVLRASEY